MPPQAKGKNKAVQTKLAKQLKKIERQIDTLAGRHRGLGFTVAVDEIPNITKCTPVALSSLVPADASTEASVTLPVQHSMQSIIGMLVIYQRTLPSKGVDNKLATAL